MEVELFDVWGIYFMGPFIPSFSNIYILIAIDYAFKQVEAYVLPSNTFKSIICFIKRNIFTHFGTPRAIISDGGSHFNNRAFESLLHKYVSSTRQHCISSPNQWPSRNVKQGIQHILEKTIKTTCKIDQVTQMMHYRHIEQHLKSRQAYLPYRLVLGKVCHLPIELKISAYWAIKRLNFDMQTAGESVSCN